MASGVLCICIGLVIPFIFGTFKRVPNMKRCKGKVVSIEWDKDYDSEKHRHSYYANIQYIVDGVEYYIKTKHTSSAYQKNKKVTIGYNRKNPSEAITFPTIGLYIHSIVWIVFGIYAIISSL